jgi:hypothetical protein
VAYSLELSAAAPRMSWPNVIRVLAVKPWVLAVTDEASDLAPLMRDVSDCSCEGVLLS